MLKNLRIVDVVLTQIAIGYKNAELIFDKIFPVVFSPKEGIKIPKFGKEAFRLYFTSRAPSGKSNQYNPEALETVDTVLEEHDISRPVDYRESAESDFDEEANAAETTSDILDLGLEKEVADLVTNPANYAETHKLALTTGLNDATSDPIALVEAAKEAIRTDIGRDPNKAVCGAKTFSILRTHPKLIELFKYAVKGVLTKEMIAEAFGVDELIVGKGVYQDDAGVMHDVWPDMLLLAYIPKTVRSYKEPAFGYIIRKSGFKQADKYPGEGGKIMNVRCTDIRRPKLVGADAGYLITNCYIEPEPEGE